LAKSAASLLRMGVTRVFKRESMIGPFNKLIKNMQIACHHDLLFIINWLLNDSGQGQENGCRMR
jgi:hypothetical protein